ncbi:regulatory protein RecX [Sphingomonas sp.]|uniref:regulatory protein RecX n=1 Tax=Sphingomonas sp. TaxID=28214 RepID=UPI0035C7983D
MRPPRSVSPLDTPKLEQLALRYVERFATTRGKLRDYLTRKIRERGWDDERAPDAAGVAERMAQRGYVDDRGFAEMKGAALERRGFGVRRVAETLRAAGVVAADAQVAIDHARAAAWENALRLAERRRIGPFALEEASDPRVRQRHLGMLLRAGHDSAIARRIVSARPGEIPEPD